ncbi:hypothetical protein HMPREF9466_01122 [Fusobacterium necrophorum subsp. funduliforme 1_1_36S]|nr:hypothetical protein HMPREF9466_01122 [Fusobacterium necrophorum subsp. funduliforme 1_1_36S]
MKQNDNIKILVVRFKRIGDAILASPVCNSLKKHFPILRLTTFYMKIPPLFLKIIPTLTKSFVFLKESREIPFYI